MRCLRFIVGVLALPTVLFSIARSEILKNQVVTYSVFNYVNSVSCTMNNVYFATTEGITRYNKPEARWEEPLTGGDGLGNENVRRVFVEEFDRRLYAETDFGFYEYDSLFDRWYSVSEVPVFPQNGRHVDIPQMMFTPPEFVYPGDGTLRDPEGRSYSITDVLYDDEGNIWFGTWGYGAAKASGNSQLMEPMPFGLIQKNVVDVLSHEGRIWTAGAASPGGRSGVSILDPGNQAFEYIEPGLFNSFTETDITCLAVSGEMVFLGARNGLMLYDRAMERVTRRLNSNQGLPDDNIYSLELIGDSLFIGTERGLAVLSGDYDSLSFDLPARFNRISVYCFEAADNQLWIGTSEGAFRLDLTTGELKRFLDPDNLLSGDVYSIAVYEDQVVFAGLDGVVWADGRVGRVETLWLNDRIGSGILSIAVNDRIVAAASSDGLILSYYNSRNQNRRTFTTRDGLPSDWLNDVIIEGDYVWIGSDEGLTRFWWNNPSRVD